MRVTIRPMGTGALLLEVADMDAVLGLHLALRQAAAAGDIEPPVDLVPAARTVLVVCPAEVAGDRYADRVAAVAASARPVADGGDDAELLTIEVRYDGPDLDSVAEHTGLTTDQVVLAHCQSTWRVAFGGFAPGFGYLAGGDPRLRVPRRTHPRPSIPAGSVGLAGEYSGVYPRASPGGWQVIGHTDLPLWDSDRDPPALLRPGVTVRFAAVGHSGGGDVDAVDADG